MDLDYKGYIEVEMNDDSLARFYSNKDLWAGDLYENQYLLIKDSTGEIVDKYCRQNGELRQVPFYTLGGTFTGVIKPRNPQQVCLFDMLKDKTSKIKLVTGRFGSGKTLAMTNAALELIEKGKFEGRSLTSYDKYTAQKKELEEVSETLGFACMQGIEIALYSEEILVFGDETIKQIFEFLENKNFPKLRELLKEMNPADIALLFEELEE